MYKIISKVLANKLKVVLHKCVFDARSTFVPGRSILDNVMVVIEVTNYMKTKTRGRYGYVTLNLDISNAYDRMYSNYLKDVMFKMSFNH